LSHQETTPEKTDKVRPLKELKAEATRFIEKKAIIHILNLTGWNKSKAAKMLKISYKALFYKMNDYNIMNTGK
jgi:DNA-binding NtrC family response regulator